MSLVSGSPQLLVLYIELIKEIRDHLRCLGTTNTSLPCGSTVSFFTTGSDQRILHHASCSLISSARLRSMRSILPNSLFKGQHRIRKSYLLRI